MRLPAARVRLGVLVALLVVAQFTLRPWAFPSPMGPDFLLIALLFYAVRSRPGAGAVAGFVVGLLTDAVALSPFGAGALALTVVGYLAGWLKALVFADNLLVNAVLVFAASWLRDVLEVAASASLRGPGLAQRLLLVAPAAALSTAAAAVLILLVARGWLRGAGGGGATSL